MSTPIALHPVLAKLREHFPPDAISWRTGPMTKDGKKTKPLAYIDARDVQDRLDSVLGLDWEDDYIPMPNGSTCCRLTITVDGRRVSRANGAELLPDKGDDAKPEQQEMAIKGSYSDAFKRAAVKFGIGQYLYGVDAPWVEVDEWKKIKASEMPKLNGLLRRLAGMPALKADPPSQSIADQIPTVRRDPLADAPGMPSPEPHKAIDQADMLPPLPADPAPAPKPGGVTERALAAVRPPSEQTVEEQAPLVKHDPDTGELPPPHDSYPDQNEPPPLIDDEIPDGVDTPFTVNPESSASFRNQLLAAMEKVRKASPKDRAAEREYYAELRKNHWKHMTEKDQKFMIGSEELLASKIGKKRTTKQESANAAA